MPFVLLMLGVVTLAVALGSKKTTPGGGGEPRTYMLDSSLPPPLRDQVLAALAGERDPAKLEAFAAALQTQFPIAASQLRARAQELRAAGAPSAPAAPFPVPNVAPAPVPFPSIPFPSVPPLPTPAQPQQPQSPAAPPPGAPAPAPQSPIPGSPALPSPLPGFGLDPGMPPDVAQAVTTALATETDPAKLRAFAASLAPRFPIAAGMLNAKANALSLLQPPSPAPQPQPTPVGPAPVPVAPAIPGATSGLAIVTTQDPPPLGDLKVFDRPNGTQIGGAEKNGTVAVLGTVQDGQTSWARIAWAGGPRHRAATGFVRQQFLRPVAAPAAPGAFPFPFPSPSPQPSPTPAPAVPFLPSAGSPLAIITTQDPPPLGDLKVFDRPNGAQIGGAEKNGTVAVLGSVQDGQTSWARIAWAGGARHKAVTGFVRQQFLRPVETPLAPSALPLPSGLPVVPALPPGLPSFPLPGLPTFVMSANAHACGSCDMAGLCRKRPAG